MKTIAFYSDARGYLEKKDRIKKIRIISGDLYRCNIGGASMPRISHKGELTLSYGPVQTGKRVYTEREGDIRFNEATRNRDGSRVVRLVNRD